MKTGKDKKDNKVTRLGAAASGGGPATTKRPRSSRRPAKSAPAELPRVPRTFVGQAESRRLIEEELSPWLVTRWESADFGIDGVVEITRPIGGSSVDEEATGKCFALQLKSTDAELERSAMSVTTGHLRYWLDHSLPVLLVSHHAPSRTMRGRWIDSELLDDLRGSTPALWSQGTVTIHLTLPIAGSACEKIEATVLRVHRRRSILTPSRFFELRTRLLEAAARLDEIGTKSAVRTVSNLAEESRKALHAAPYTVVIAGSQRVGKSTLVNALLRTEISPVEAFPTTAVPIMFRSALVTGAVAVFADGRRERIEATVDGLRPYATQRENSGNAKAVAAVEVSLPNDVLARGISLADAPGLRDASAAVRAVTARLLDDADAVVYVLDAALGAKFKIDQGVIDDLSLFRKSKERLIVVLNQEDALNPEGRAPLAAYVERELRAHGIWNGLPETPFFISGQAAFESQRRGEPLPESFALLEDRLWGHLLRTRSTGLARLARATQRLEEACVDAGGLLGSRATDGQAADVLNRSIDSCRVGIDELHRAARQWRNAAANFLESSLRSRVESRTAELVARLTAIPANQPLPSREAIEVELRAEWLEDATQVWGWFRGEVGAFAEAQGQLLSRALDDARASLGMPKPVSVPLPSALPLQPIDMSLSESWLGLLVWRLFSWFWIHVWNS